MDSGDEDALDIAIRTYENILSRKDNPEGRYNRRYGRTRPLKNFGMPKTLCNLTLEMEHVLDPIVVERSLNICLHEVLEVFLDPDQHIVYENVFPDGRRSDTIEGRLIHPGNGIEAMWFAMEIALRRGDQALMENATQVVIDTLEFAWDREFGGIFQWLDAKACPIQRLDWDQKLWWVHLEALISLTKGYLHTQNEACLPWIRKVHEYTWSHFPDPTHGEWFGYLNRQGEVLTPLKGGQRKGFFHLPRALYKCWQNMEQIAILDQQKGKAKYRKVE